ncbi:hypothetical protein [Salimicrobium halophilum]|uniref:Lipoprotein n=1 Tax=Salimicrobium halophilum TaxID=86666 RepID=A0A1G8RFM8_9BACI|nr:hypothetical protein [Salimicrobium halophilum]SDJ15721.1 hypothetical protein SAMN04490247_1000 [Salimicrobium halophilum]
MKRNLWIVLFLLPLLMASCSNQKTFYYEGESDNWKVEYQVDITSQDSQSESASIQYIGDDAIPERIDYLIETRTGKNAGSTPLSEEGVKRLSPGSCSGCSVVMEDEEVSATIEWEGHRERIVLSQNQ